MEGKTPFEWVPAGAEPPGPIPGTTEIVFTVLEAEERGDGTRLVKKVQPLIGGSGYAEQASAQGLDLVKTTDFDVTMEGDRIILRPTWKVALGD